MIEIINWEEVRVDGVSSGDLISTILNYPQRTVEIKQALSKLTLTPTVVQINSSDLDSCQQELSLANSRILKLEKELQQYRLGNIETLIKRMKEAGFYDYLAAVIALHPDQLDSVANLREQIGLMDIEGVKRSYLSVASCLPPDEAKVRNWQSILDDLGITALSFL